MSKLSPYLSTKYEDGGRGPVGHDCWSLTRIARHELYGLPLLPSYAGIHPDDKASLTSGCLEEMRASLKPCEAKPGAIATAWRGKMCVHIGLCVDKDGRLSVLETNRHTGPRCIPIKRFERAHTKVVYLDDRDLQQPV